MVQHFGAVGDVSKHASPNHSRASLNLIVEPKLYMLLGFQKAAVRGNYETGIQAFSMHLRFLTIRAGYSVDGSNPVRLLDHCYLGEFCLRHSVTELLRRTGAT